MVYSLSYSIDPSLLRGGSWSEIGNGAVGHFNQDVFPDIVFSTDIRSASSPVQTPVAIYVFDESTGNFDLLPLTIDGVPNSHPQVFFGRDIISVDINHDGISDVIPIDQSEIHAPPGTNATFLGQEQFAYISNGVGNYSKVSLSAGAVNVHGFGVINSADGVFRVLLNTPWSDYNPGGTATAICAYDEQSGVFNTQLITRSDQFFADAPQNGWPGYFYQTTIDANGDGNTDIVAFSTEGGKSNLYLNDGHGGFEYYKPLEIGLARGIVIEEATTGDFNGDGYQDLVVLGVDRSERPGSEFKSLRILINDGNSGFVDQSEQWLHGMFQNVDASFGYLDAFNLNGDQNSDFIFPFLSSAGPYNPSVSEQNIVFVSTGTDFQTFETSGAGRRIPLSDSSWIQNWGGNSSTNIYELTIEGEIAAVNHRVTPAIFDGASENYDLEINANHFSLSNLLTNRSFLIEKNIERIAFSDTNVALDIAPTQNAGSVYMLYKAAFNRAPDAGGMGYWLAQKDGGANIVTNIAQGFVNSSEFISKYGSSPTNVSYVSNLYHNVLGRAGEAEGVAYWTNEMDAGRVSKAEALVQFATLVEGAGNVAPLIANGIQYQEWIG